MRFTNLTRETQFEIDDDEFARLMMAAVLRPGGAALTDVEYATRRYMQLGVDQGGIGRVTASPAELAKVPALLERHGTEIMTAAGLAPRLGSAVIL